MTPPPHTHPWKKAMCRDRMPSVMRGWFRYHRPIPSIYQIRPAPKKTPLTPALCNCGFALRIQSTDMLITQWLVHCALAFATTTLSHHTQYRLDPGLDESEFGKNPLFSLHKNLINIESISGNEQDVGEFLEAYLKCHNYTVERQYVDPLPTTLQDSQAEEREQKQRFNLLAYPGENRQTPVLLTSHIDTVPPYYGYEIHEHDEIWGRGSVDAKACVGEHHSIKCWNKRQAKQSHHQRASSKPLKNCSLLERSPRMMSPFSSLLVKRQEAME